MRTFLSSLVTLFLIACIAGCGNDNSTGNNNNPPATHDSLIASFDSLSAANFIAPYYNGYGFDDLIEIHDFRVSFNVSANLDSTNGSYLNFHSTFNNDTTHIFTIEKFNTNLNDLSVVATFSHSISNIYQFSMLLQFGFESGFPSLPNRTIKVYDFKLFAVISN